MHHMTTGRIGALAAFAVTGAAAAAIAIAPSIGEPADVRVPMPADRGASFDFATYTDIVTGNAPAQRPAPTSWVDLMLPPQ